ncbi:hypothetical protein NQ318_016777 [Aromia moschata]|uniref:Uncharacterized protein n=1 Tax=Aromia moschata TaxID=1265417 RepID=A0AAV8Y4V1_9CUCU|nr:hypothetical protein NQ318_016777 [Aromia moschata]
MRRLSNLPSGIPLPEEIVIPGDLPENEENNLLNIGVKSEPQDDEYIFKGPAAVSTENEHHSNSRKKNKNKLQHEDNLPCVPKEMSVLETVSFGVDFFENSKGKLLLEDSMLINKWLDNLDNTESTDNCKIDKNSRYFNNAGECGVLDPTGVNFNNDSVEKRSLSKDTYPSSSEGYKSDSSELRDKPNRKKTNEDQLIHGRDCDNVDVVKETNALEKLDSEDVYTENSLEINHNKVVEDSGLCEKEEHQKIMSEKNDPQTKVKSTKKQNVVTSDSSDEDRVGENTDDPRTEEDREKLNQIPIMITFQVCPLHSILTRASIPTAAQKAEIKKLKLEVKTGPFNKVENETIMENWRKFCEEYGFSGNPGAFVNFSRKLHQEQITGFLRYLGRGLENRMLHLIHARFKIMVQKSKTKCGRFSTEEDRKILEYFSESRSRHPFSDLAKILKRTKCSIAKRYEKLKEYQATSKTRVDWTPELMGKFLKHLKRITKCDIGSLQHRPITLDEWKKLSEKMAPISIKKLRFAWENTIYPRLYANEGVNLRKIKKKIIKMLIKQKETDWRTLNWKDIAKKNPRFYTVEEKQANLKDSLDYLNDALLKYDLIPTTHKFTKIKH